MEEDMYSDGTSAAPADAAPPEDQGGQTALIPKEIQPGLKPGDPLTLTVVSVQEDSYACSSRPEPPAAAPASEPGADEAYA